MLKVYGHQNVERTVSPIFDAKTVYFRPVTLEINLDHINYFQWPYTLSHFYRYVSDSVNQEENVEHIIKWSGPTQRKMQLQQDHGERQKCRNDCRLDFQIFPSALNASQSVPLSSMPCDKNEILLWNHNMLNINKLISFIKFRPKNFKYFQLVLYDFNYRKLSQWWSLYAFFRLAPILGVLPSVRPRPNSFVLLLTDLARFLMGPFLKVGLNRKLLILINTWTNHRISSKAND